MVINTIVTLWGKVPRFLDFVRPDALGDAHHPKEFVDVVARVANHTTKDDEHVVDIVFTKNGVRDLFRTGHCLAHRRDMSCERASYLTYEDITLKRLLLFHVLLSTSVGRSAMPAI